MISNKAALLDALDRVACGMIFEHDVALLRSAIEQLDEMDDLVDAVCTCRTQDIPVIRLRDDDAPGRP